jgi:opacity protein-like surface antigen
MRLTRAVAIAVCVVGLLGPATSASADITGFLGLAGGPATRGAKGVSVGAGFVIVGVEFEYSDLGEDFAGGAPHVRTGMANALVQTPAAVGGVQLYATAGGGLYRHDLGTASETSVGTNVGGGAKITLAGPLRVRIDYRYFRFAGSPIGADGVHRVYVGANLTF